MNVIPLLYEYELPNALKDNNRPIQENSFANDWIPPIELRN